jgi:hypothetical protein
MWSSLMLQLALRLEVDAAGVLAVQAIERRGHLAPDALLLGGVLDERRTEPLETVAATHLEECLAAGDVARVAEPGMPRFELEPVDVGRVRVDVGARVGSGDLRLIHASLHQGS